MKYIMKSGTHSDKMRGVVLLKVAKEEINQYTGTVYMFVCLWACVLCVCMYVCVCVRALLCICVNEVVKKGIQLCMLVSHDRLATELQLLYITSMPALFASWQLPHWTSAVIVLILFNELLNLC